MFHGHSVAVFNANTRALFLKNAYRILYTCAAIRVLKVTQIATCSALAATVIDSENDDAFFGPIASWFVLIDDRFQNETDSKHRNSLFTQCIINK